MLTQQQEWTSLTTIGMTNIKCVGEKERILASKWLTEEQKVIRPEEKYVRRLFAEYHKKCSLNISSAHK